MNRLFILFTIIIALLLPFMINEGINTDFSSININDGILIFNNNVMLIGEQTQTILTNLVDTIGEWQELGQQALNYISGLINGFSNWWQQTEIYKLYELAKALLDYWFN